MQRIIVSSLTQLAKLSGLPELAEGPPASAVTELLVPEALQASSAIVSPTTIVMPKDSHILRTGSSYHVRFIDRANRSRKRSRRKPREDVTRVSRRSSDKVPVPAERRPIWSPSAQWRSEAIRSRRTHELSAPICHARQVSGRRGKAGFQFLRKGAERKARIDREAEGRQRLSPRSGRYVQGCLDVVLIGHAHRPRHRLGLIRGASDALHGRAAYAEVAQKGIS